MNGQVGLLPSFTGFLPSFCSNDGSLTGQAYDHVYSCPWDSESFVFVHCGDPDDAADVGEVGDHWGGVRFSVASFEEQLIEQRRTGVPHRPTVASHLRQQSKLHYVHIE